jgi:hypothetical protein
MAAVPWTLRTGARLPELVASGGWAPVVPTVQAADMIKIAANRLKDR